MTHLREYQPDDLAPCERIVTTVWGFPGRLTPPRFASLATHLYTVGSLTESTRARVVDDGEVRGFLFGRIAGADRITTEMTSPRGGLRIMARFLFMRRVGIRCKLRWIEAIRGHERARSEVEPPGETEITLFAVDPYAQGRGHGRQLVDDFVDACRDAEAHRIIVETDRQSNYGFYEAYGFDAVDAFDSPMNALFSGGGGESIVYELVV